MAHAIAGRQFRWPNRRVPFVVEPTLLSNSGAARAVRTAVEHWNHSTVIRLEEKTNSDTDYVSFELALLNCASPIGRRGGKQRIGCGLTAGGFTAASVIHEIGHSVGLFHEQCRLDRDRHVRIDFDNVLEPAVHNFRKTGEPCIDVGEYDYFSIMHYPPTAFARNAGTPTIICTPSPCPAAMGAATGLSGRDIAAVEAIYSLDYRTLGGAEWQFPPIAMAALGGHLYIIEASVLWKVDPNSGNAAQVGTTTFGVPPLAMAALDGHLYVIEASVLWRVDPNSGNAVQVGTTTFGVAPIAMTTLGGHLYVIEASVLWRVDPDSGNAVQVGGTTFGVPPIAMAALGGSLFVLEAAMLWKVDPNSGQAARVGSTTFGVSPIAMTALSGSLYIVEASNLWRAVPNSGVVQPLGTAIWKRPPINLVAILDDVYVIENQHLQRIFV